MCQVPSVVNDLWSQTYAPLRTGQHTMAGQNEGVTQAIGRFYWDDSETVFLGILTIYVSILYLLTFSESNAWDFHLVMTEISVNVPATSEDFDEFPKTSERCQKIKCPQIFSKAFEHFRSYLKDDTFSVLWYDFVVSQAWEIVLDAWYRCL